MDLNRVMTRLDPAIHDTEQHADAPAVVGCFRTRSHQSHERERATPRLQSQQRHICHARTWLRKRSISSCSFSFSASAVMRARSTSISASMRARSISASLRASSACI